MAVCSSTSKYYWNWYCAQQNTPHSLFTACAHGICCDEAVPFLLYRCCSSDNSSSVIAAPANSTRTGTVPSRVWPDPSSLQCCFHCCSCSVGIVAQTTSSPCFSQLSNDAVQVWWCRQQWECAAAPASTVLRPAKCDTIPLCCCFETVCTVLILCSFCCIGSGDSGSVQSHQQGTHSIGIALLFHCRLGDVLRYAAQVWWPRQQWQCVAAPANTTGTGTVLSRMWPDPSSLLCCLPCC